MIEELVSFGAMGAALASVISALVTSRAVEETIDEELLKKLRRHVNQLKSLTVQASADHRLSTDEIAQLRAALADVSKDLDQVSGPIQSSSDSKTEASTGA